jgi:hypothetical protein
VTSGGVTSCVNRDPLPGETFTGPFDCELCDFLCSLASSTTLAP